MKRRQLLSGLILLLAAILLWLLIPRLAALLVHEPAPQWQRVAAEDCDLHRQACRVELPAGGWLELSLAPRPLRMLTPFEIQVSLAGLQAESVAVDFVGVEMDMGYNRVRLQRSDEGLYRGQGMLPMCVDERMSWLARVLLPQADGLGVVVFRFETTRRISE